MTPNNEPDTHYAPNPFVPALCGAVKPDDYPLLTTSTLRSVTCEKCGSLIDQRLDEAMGKVYDT